MKQPIAGVCPSQVDEATIMVTWPSISATWLGRLLGRAYNIKWPNIYIFRLGNLLALLSIPLALALYFYRLAPSVLGMPLHGSFYKLTNRRVLVLRNEINLGPGSAFTRTVCGLSAIIGFFVIRYLCEQFVFNWTVVPRTALHTIVAVVCLAGFLGGVIPLAFPVPIPRFKYAAEVKFVDLDRFDTIQIVRRPGQEWYDAGDLVFSLAGVETFRLSGVSRPHAFRSSCMHAHRAYVGIKQALERQTKSA